MASSPLQLDPINSPHPVPWNWVMAMLNQSAMPSVNGDELTNPQRHLYRTQGLRSPDHRYVAYSRIQLHVTPDRYSSHLTSVLFLENLETGNIQVITPTSPLANSPFCGDEAKRDGTISMVIPIAWSEVGDRLLAREFEGILYSDVASDYAVIVDLVQQGLSTICPTPAPLAQPLSEASASETSAPVPVGDDSSPQPYTTAVLLGWSEAAPDCALFSTAILGQVQRQLAAVDSTGQTRWLSSDRPLVYGELISTVWMGPQADTA